MTARENIAFGLKGKYRLRQSVTAMAEKLQIGELLGKYPGELSGASSN